MDETVETTEWGEKIHYSSIISCSTSMIIACPSLLKHAKHVQHFMNISRPRYLGFICMSEFFLNNLIHT